MSRLTIDLTMSLDGYVAGPDPSQEDPLGVGGERLHELLDNLGDPPGLTIDRVIASPAVTHIRYRVAS